MNEFCYGLSILEFKCLFVRWIKLTLLKSVFCPIIENSKYERIFLAEEQRRQHLNASVSVLNAPRP